MDLVKFNKLISELKLPSPLQKFFIEECNREIYFKRDDLIHPVISGNKWRKLSYFFRNYSENDYDGVISMGGAYSNHLHALAYVCDQLSVPCKLLIYGWRGELNSPTLMDCVNWNAKLISLTRKDAAKYRMDGINKFLAEFENYLWIPEGGSGNLGIQGIAMLMNELDHDVDQKENLIVCASGTGTTVKGILENTKNCRIATQQIVKMGTYSWIANKRIFIIPTKANHSFAKVDFELNDFIKSFNLKYEILLDPVYTATLFNALINLDLRSFGRIYFIHTGGLQANRLTSQLDVIG